jgi:hypothetical protein
MIPILKVVKAKEVIASNICPISDREEPFAFAGKPSRFPSFYISFSISNSLVLPEKRGYQLMQS